MLLCRCPRWNEDGHLTTIDLKSAKSRKPNIEELLEKLGLSSYVTVYYEPTSYNWRLMRLIEENSKPIFDFCYIDGGHDGITLGMPSSLSTNYSNPEVGFFSMMSTEHTIWALVWKIRKWLKESRWWTRNAPSKTGVWFIGKTSSSLSYFMDHGNWTYVQKKKSFWDRFR